MWVLIYYLLLLFSVVGVLLVFFRYLRSLRPHFRDLKATETYANIYYESYKNGEDPKIFKQYLEQLQKTLDNKTYPVWFLNLEKKRISHLIQEYIECIEWNIQSMTRSTKDSRRSMIDIFQDDSGKLQKI